MDQAREVKRTKQEDTSLEFPEGGNLMKVVHPSLNL
jgi:hypothetical protein